MSGRFTQVVVCDFEYEVADGDLPDVLCMVAYVLDEHLNPVRTVKIWRGEFKSTPPFDIGLDTLFIAYSAWAEMTCFAVLGWKFPTSIFDLHTAYLSVSNILLPNNPNEPHKRQQKRLSDACKAYDIRRLGEYRQTGNGERYRRGSLAGSTGKSASWNTAKRMSAPRLNC